MSKGTKWWLTLAGKYLLVILAIILYTIIICRAQARKDADWYAAAFEAYKAEVQTQAEALAAAPSSEAEALKTDAELMAKVLYGVKDNSTDDLRTLCWCVINRADNPSYPDTIAEVVDQPQQWMGYSDANPVLESLYQIAYAELTSWKSDYRPVSNEYVYMSWSPYEIVLRNDFDAGSQTRYWRMK